MSSRDLALFGSLIFVVIVGPAWSGTRSYRLVGKPIVALSPKALFDVALDIVVNVITFILWIVLLSTLRLVVAPQQVDSLGTGLVHVVAALSLAYGANCLAGSVGSRLASSRWLAKVRLYAQLGIVFLGIGIVLSLLYLYVFR